jgi:uncharacterized protein (DUF1697 family)
MPRYVAFLRGVSPMNLKMPDLKRCFEEAGFENVKTIITSGNVAFDARGRPEANIEARAEQAMKDLLGRTFFTIVRSSDSLQALLTSDPYAGHRIAKGAKRIVIFMRTPQSPRIKLPATRQGGTLLRQIGKNAFAAYTGDDNGPALMRLIEQAFGQEITTRTWQTVEKCAVA